MEKEILKQCKIQPINSGSYSNTSWLTSDEPVTNIISINPATEQPIAEVIPTNLTQFQKIVSQAKKHAEAWGQVPAPKRGELIRKIGVLLRKNKEFLASLISLEMGKIKAEAEGEVQEMIDMADFAVGQSRMLYGKTMHSERAQHRMYEQWHPLGVVAVITAFNFPMAVWAWNAFLAAICGNVVIWKPSSKVPLCAIALQHICSKAMKRLGYSGIFSLAITEDKHIAELLLSNKHIGLVSFTGSSSVGHLVAETVSKRFGRYLLECSGNNAIIIDKTADLKLAIPAIVFGAVGTAGQRCTTTRRLIVHESLMEQVVDALLHAYKQIQVGDPLDKQNLMGPLISEDAMNAFTQAMSECQKYNAEIVAGGNILPGTGYYVEPTIVRAENHWPIVQEETFAPILYVMSFKDFDDAVRMQNMVPQGLSSALFSTHIKNIEKFLSAQGSDCGIANINIGTSGAEIGGAFGGEKETGGGREAGSDAWKNYMRRQTTTINWSDKLPLAQGIKFYD
ncbi:MAG: aldehyde dehydrogenase family protein [Gammaproteobacteria bacterium]|nr:aldehyde dehydrogenase family protein [Gammaproteobacteria bacterium]